MSVQQRTKVICNGETYYHYCSIDPKEEQWAAIYDADHNLLFSESEKIPIKAISLMLKAYQKGIADGSKTTRNRLKSKVMKMLKRK